MSKYDNCETLEEAIAVWQELDPWSERTNSGTAEAIILQAVKDKELVPVVRGKWIDERWRNNPFGSTVPYSCDATCSACGIHSDVRIRRGKKEWGINSPYCPACGADMKEHED